MFAPPSKGVAPKSGSDHLPTSRLVAQQRTVSRTEPGEQRAHQTDPATLVTPARLSHIPLFPPNSQPQSQAVRVQCRHAAGSSTDGDPLEAEAERIADKVVQNTSPGAVHMAAPRISQASTSDGYAVAALRTVDPTLAGGGAPLAPTVRQDMEQRLGFDLSAVRIHSGPAAECSARELRADAYTLGHDIVFGAGKFAPDTQQGRHLLAHELVHVQQQRASAPCVQRKPTDPDELAAIDNEDKAVTDLATRAIKSGTPQFAVHEVLWRLINSRGLDMHFELSGSRYDKNHKGITIESKGKGPRTTGFVVAGDEVLQRLAKGQVAQVAKELETQIAGVDTARGTIDYVFIMGKDTNKKNQFYTEAKKYFQAQYPSATMVEDVRDLDGINERINAGAKPVANLIIVSHAHPDGTVAFSLNKTDKTPGQLQYSELKEANEKGSLVKPDPELIGFWTNVLIRGCNLGRSEAMLGEVQTAFGGSARVIAPTHSQVYSGGTTQAFAGPFYEEPGRSKLTDEQAFAKIKAKPEYGFVTDWDAMRKSLKRTDDATTEIVYEGPFPTPGQEMAFLRAASPKTPTKEYKFDASRIEGVKTVFMYKAIHPMKFGPIEVAQETPPDEATAIARAKAKVARPDAYTYKVRPIRQGVMLQVAVDIVRTEWNLYHSELHKAGKPFDPSPGVKPWFGDTE
ncbi:hypothetical protein GCM10007862_09790 [Dyella lipolytica]|uniref:DUF4157 domain-containing protein n=1 Tax=Dyella lipolytica TaxID=1867835 RepID=A0ABW8J0Z1_9GAMM|nr:DUF4157 domain-containing protein [Dyella lipolytica]GLQ45928.1 hypothetical protein GCM10007862_09790 [Dyella lipolytica]